MSRKRFLILFGLLSLLILGMTASTTFAKGEIPFRPTGLRKVTTVSNGGTIETVVTQSYTNVITEENGTDSLSQTVNGQTVEYSNCAGAATNGSFVYHCYARTKRIAGSGNYRTEAHAALLDGATIGSPSVFDYLQNPCAQVAKSNAESKTCQSPNFNSSHGRKWFIVSGHSFDTDLNPPYQVTCSGCIDWVFTTP